MRFMTMVKSSENAGPPPTALSDAIAKAVEEATKNGTLIEAGGLFPSAQGTRVRLSAGKVTVTDGPFSEAKEVVGGYAIFEFKSKQEAIDATLHFIQLHKEHWPGWEGESEVRQIFAEADFAAPPAETAKR